MARHEEGRQEVESEPPPTGEAAQTSSTTELEPDTWSQLKEFREQFTKDAVFGVVGHHDGAERYWIVSDIDKVRPAAVPIDQPTTFDMAVLGPDGKVSDEIRMTLEEIKHVRATEPTGGPSKTNDE